MFTAAVLMSPAAMHGAMTHQSFALDTVWTQGFSDGLASGDPYPRWLPGAFGGLGAPVFYFYPPLAFYLSSGLHLAGLPIWLAIVAAGWLMLASSGLAMRAWTGNQGAALLYMLAPYHLFCFYVRGDIAEFGAYVWTPLICLAIRDRRWLSLAVAYAALILTHVPSTLLVSALIVGPYVVLQRERGVTLRAGVALATGTGLAATYLMPAIALQRYASLDSMTFGAFYRPMSWAFWNIAHPPSFALLVIIMGLTIALAATAIAAGRSFWTCIALAACACVAGFPIWLLPVFDHLQFPYRALIVVEFALCTALAGRALPVRLVPFLAIAVVAFGFALPNPPLSTLSEADEYLPAGYIATHRVPRFAQITPPGGPGPLGYPAFWFPGWSCPHSTTYPAPGSELVAFADPTCHPERVATLPEILGGAISALAAAGLLLVLSLRHWRPKASRLIEPKPVT